MSSRPDKAVDVFNSGFNCAQATLTSFSDKLKTDKNTLMSITAGFGGGMGKLQETCGAVTGAFMLFSLYTAEYSEDNAEHKDLSAEMIREFNKLFIERHGSINCRKLLGVDLLSDEGQAAMSEQDLLQKVCAKCIHSAVSIAEKILDSE